MSAEKTPSIQATPTEEGIKSEPQTPLSPDQPATSQTITEKANESSPAPSESKDVESQAPPPPPYHIFSRARKRQMVYIVSVAALFSPLSSNIYFPALGRISRVRNDYSYQSVNV